MAAAEPDRPLLVLKNIERTQMATETQENGNDLKKQTALEFLCDVGHISQKEAELLIEKLEKQHQETEDLDPLSYSSMSAVAPVISAETAILFFDRNLNITHAQGKGIDQLGIASDNWQGKNLSKVFHNDVYEQISSKLRNCLRGEIEEFLYLYNDHYCRVFTYPRLDNSENIIGGVAVIHNITEFVEQKVQLDLLKKAIDSTQEMVVITNAKNRIGEEEILYVNKGFEQTTGYSREEVLGKNPSLLQGPDTERAVINELVDKLSEGEQFVGETFNYRKDGSRFRLRWHIDPVKDETGNITHYISIQRDVTDEWQQKQHLEQLIADREAVLKEIHHRIKNNLAVISGLLELQTLQRPSEETQEILLQSMNRIKSIAILHETLYKTDSFSEIQLDSYFTEIAVQVTDAFITDEHNITVETDIAPVSLTDLQAMPSGLILNEVITNSCKHAFKDIKECIIRIEVKGDTEEEPLRIRVSDNGCGLPDNFNIKQQNTLGLNLIHTLCQQLNAEYSFDSSSKGTTFSMSFFPDRS